MNDIFLTEEQKDLKDVIKAFMQGEVKPHIAEYDESGEFPVEIYQKAFELGFGALHIPEEYGGSGLDFSTMGILLEEMGKVESGFALTLLANGTPIEMVLREGSDEQKRRMSDLMERGGFAALGLTEPSCGSDAAALRATYRIEGDTVVLNGVKTFVTNGEYSELFLMLATKDRKLGTKGITAFMIEKDTPGLSIGAHENKMGLRWSNTCEVSMNDVRVPLSAMVGKEGKGLSLALGALNPGRLYNAAIATGISQAALDASVEYAKMRESMGKKIIDHQAIQVKLADMAIRTEASRQLVRLGMAKLDAGMDATKEASMAKTFASDSAVQNTVEAIQVFGGYGYSKEYPVEKLMRDSKIFQIFEGTNEIQRIIIARELKDK